MARAASTFRQNDLTRAVKGAVAGGIKIAKVEIDKEGKIILVAESGDRHSLNSALNEWDSVLK